MKLRFFIVLLLFESLSSTGQGVSFYKENITMKIDGGYFYVTGDYYLRSEGPSSLPIVYPLPHGPLYGAVDSVYIFSMGSGEEICPVKNEPTLVLFLIDFTKQKEQAVQISYRQKLTGMQAEYILKSTVSWKKPIEVANYELIVPKGIRIDTFSIPPDNSMDTGSEIVYYWERRNFMPNDNMVFGFTEQ